MRYNCCASSYNSPTERMVAGRPLPNTKPVKPSNMPRSDCTSDSSVESDGSEKDPFADPPTTNFNIPSPVSLSDAEEDASPSQYQKEMLRQQARRQSDDEEEEEEDEEEEDMEEEEEEPRERVKSRRPRIDDMYSEFMNIARKFTSMVEDTRKQELMSRRTARQSLEFDSPPRQPAKYRHPQFTPPRHAREQIQATQDDDDDIERDSLCSSRTGSTRIRLQDRWRIIGTKNKVSTTDHEIRQWIEEHAVAEMAKAGHYEDLRPASTDVGGFKRVHVSQCKLRIWMMSVI